MAMAVSSQQFNHLTPLTGGRRYSETDVAHHSLPLGDREDAVPATRGGTDFVGFFLELIKGMLALSLQF